MMKNESIHGFTLTELLVLLVVGAVLTTFLLAASSDSKQQLQAAACLNNMRQWGMGFMMYADDYNDYFPFEGVAGLDPCDPANVPAWYDVVPPYIGQKPLCQLYMAGTPPTPLTKGIWTCPSATLTNVAPTRSSPYFMYAMSTCWHSWLSLFDGLQRNRMTSPSNTILFCEASEDNFPFTNGKYLNLVPNPGGGIAARHFAGANFVFGDGHAGWIAFTNFCRSGNAGCPFPGSNIEWNNSGPGGDWHPIVKYHWWPLKFANTSPQ